MGSWCTHCLWEQYHPAERLSEKEQLPHKFSFQAMLFFSAYLGLGGGGITTSQLCPPYCVYISLRILPIANFKVGSYREIPTMRATLRIPRVHWSWSGRAHTRKLGVDGNTVESATLHIQEIHDWQTFMTMMQPPIMPRQTSITVEDFCTNQGLMWNLTLSYTTTAILVWSYLWASRAYPLGLANLQFRVEFN